MQGKRYASRWPRLGRRDMLSVLGAGAAAFAAACGSSSNSGSGGAPSGGASTQTGGAGAGSPVAGSTSGDPIAPGKRGGEYVVTAATGGQTLDPHIGLNANYLYAGYWSDMLLTPQRQNFDPIQPGLVEKWEQPDATHLTLKVRPGVKYAPGHLADGRLFAADDVTFNLKRVAGALPQDASRKALFIHADTLRGQDTVTTVDPSTTAVTLSSPNAVYLYGVADWHNWIVAPEQIDKDPDFKNPAQTAGTGAFMFESWDATNTVGRFVRNPNYWRGQGLPYFDAVKQVYIPDPSAQTAAFVSKQTHWLPIGNPATQTAVTAARPDAVVEKWDAVNWNYFRLNQTRGAFGDVRVRQALQLALDYKTLNDGAIGAGNWSYTGPISAPFPGAWKSDEVAKKPGWNPDTKQQDIANAKSLLQTAGFANGKGLDFGILATNPAAAAQDVPIRLQDQLQKVFTDIKIRIDVPTDGADGAKRLTTGNYDAVVYTEAPPPNPVLKAAQAYFSTGARNYTKLADQQVDDLVNKAFAALDVTERNKLVGQLEQRLVDIVVMIPLALPKYVAAFDPRIRGFHDWSGPGAFNYYNPLFASYQMSFA